MNTADVHAIYVINLAERVRKAKALNTVLRNMPDGNTQGTLVWILRQVVRSAMDGEMSVALLIPEERYSDSFLRILTRRGFHVIPFEKGDGDVVLEVQW